MWKFRIPDILLGNSLLFEQLNWLILIWDCILNDYIKQAAIYFRFDDQTYYIDSSRCGSIQVCNFICQIWGCSSMIWQSNAWITCEPTTILQCPIYFVSSHFLATNYFIVHLLWIYVISLFLWFSWFAFQ